MASFQSDPLPLSPDEKRVARRLTALLRHGKPKVLPITPDGFISLQNIRSVHGFETLNLELARSIVHEDNKMRFSLKMFQEDGDQQWFIRANQGHTIQGIDEEKLLEKIINPNNIPIAVHGTYYLSWPLIKENGLSKMDRNHIHLAIGLPEDKESGVISGMRKSSELLIYINVEKSMELGAIFYKSTNGVILTSGIGSTGCLPIECFKQVIDYKTNKIIYHGHTCNNGADTASEKADDEYIFRYALNSLEQGGKGNGKKNKQMIKKNQPQGPPQQQCKWPEYVGQNGEIALTILKEQYPNLNVLIIPPELSKTTKDKDFHRIRIFVNEENIILKPPKLG
mmetsp:Transcript_21036/g.24866  ORF Transcript_21036/g.24866 Transcript_21036/m.24866 type:complete len:339 (+) Transcript_21036:31-1047(+)